MAQTRLDGIASVPRILLLTGTPPGDGGVGELYLRDLCQAYPHGHLSCFAVLDRDRAVHSSPDLSFLPSRIVRRSSERVVRPFGNGIGRLIALQRFFYRRWVEEAGLFASAVQFGQQQCVDLVWAVLNRPVMYRLASAVADRLGVPLVTTVWDPPERITGDLWYGRLLGRVCLRDFDRAVSQSLRCATASDEMRTEYAAKYGVATIAMPHGISLEQCRPPATAVNADDRFTIGFAGSLYASREWSSLLSALSHANWRVDNKHVIVRLLAAEVNLAGHHGAHIEYYGWRPMPEVIQLLAGADINYLPYWFDPYYRASVRLCFPAKFTSYLASGRPIFYHGPLDSSPTKFIDRYPVGICCHSIEPEHIVEIIEHMASDAVSYARMTRAGQDALHEELSLEIFLRRFATLVNVDVESLVPPSNSPVGMYPSADNAHSLL